MKKDVTILIAAMNEEDNLRTLVPRLHELFGKNDSDYEILIIDGNSVDGTAATSHRLGCRVEKQAGPGYASAILQGIRSARGEFLIVMDADHSHPPEDAWNLFRHRGKADIVINSRYVPGGGSKSPAIRRLLSAFLNVCYRRMLGLPFREVSGGFRIYRRRLLLESPFQSVHYEVQEELILMPYWRGCSILEIPYTYYDRDKGTSKARIFQYGMHLLLALLRFRKLRAKFEADPAKRMAG